MEKKPAWRPKKYESDERAHHFGSGIPLHFQDTFEKLTELAKTDTNEDFKKYCEDVEGINFDKLGMGRQSMYLRWIATRHVLLNMHKLKK